MTIAEESLALHYEKKGKIEVISTVPVTNAAELSLAYTPGVEGVKRFVPDTVRSAGHTPCPLTVIIDSQGGDLYELGPQAYPDSVK